MSGRLRLREALDSGCSFGGSDPSLHTYNTKQWVYVEAKPKQQNLSGACIKYEFIKAKSPHIMMKYSQSVCALDVCNSVIHDNTRK